MKKIKAVRRGRIYYLDGNAIRGVNCQCVVSKYCDTVVVGRKPIYLPKIGRANGKLESLLWCRFFAIYKATRGKYYTIFLARKRG